MTDVGIELCAYIAPERSYEEGVKAGMSEEAADYFRHFEEVCVVVTADLETGKVKGWKLK